MKKQIEYRNLVPDEINRELFLHFERSSIRGSSKVLYPWNPDCSAKRDNMWT